MRNLIYLFLFISFLSFSQEDKRLALVIGNANYDKGELKNPVNDAKLIANTLDSIGFDVLLHTNIERRRDFLAAINEFGTKLPEYDVSFIYYAGHGIQINSENFLLPTKEIFDMEIDVEDYGVSVQRILKYMESKEKEKINILVIDACRDNPFEQGWNNTRSLKGSGLAKLNPPTGSIIAFSTDSGNTAPDGDGENSIYTEALSRNLLQGGVSIEQVFKSVRADVLNASNGIQKPIENNTLIGDPYIINKTQKSIIKGRLYNYWLNSKTNNGYFFSSEETIEINKILDELSLYDINDPYVHWFNIMTSLSEDAPDYKFIDKSFEQLRLNDSNWINYIKYLKYVRYSSEIIVINCNSENKLYCLTLIESADILYRELISIEAENVAHFNLFNEMKDWLYGYYIDPIEIAKAYYKFNELEKAYDLYETAIDFYEKSLEDKYFIANPRAKNTRKAAIAGVEEGLLFVKEKKGVDEKEIIIGWRNLYKKHNNNTNLLMNRIYKVLSLYEFELAIDLINKTISLSPDDPEPYFILYNIYMDSEDYSSALMNIDFAIERYKDGFYISDQIKNIGPTLLITGGYNNIVQNVIYPWELRVFKAELLEKLGNNLMMCEEYKKSLELISELGDDEIFQKYSALINEKCN